MTHELKTLPQYFKDIWRGEKTFEIRKNDRDFKVGDMILLRRYDNTTDTYDGSTIEGTITYITEYRQRSGYVVFGFDMGQRRLRSI